MDYDNIKYKDTKRTKNKKNKKNIYSSKHIRIQMENQKIQNNPMVAAKIHKTES
jgi:translation initiation factor IF-3